MAMQGVKVNLALGIEIIAEAKSTNCLEKFELMLLLSMWSIDLSTLVDSSGCRRVIITINVERSTWLRVRVRGELR